MLTDLETSPFVLLPLAVLQLELLFYTALASRNVPKLEQAGVSRTHVISSLVDQSS